LDNKALFLAGKINPMGELTYLPARMEMLRNPRVGDKWSWQSSNSNDYLEYEVIREEEIHVPAGHFKSFVIKTNGFLEGTSLNDSFLWQADNIGTVKEEINTNNVKSIRELTKYKVNLK
jgi:hypothetical protein